MTIIRQRRKPLLLLCFFLLFYSFVNAWSFSGFSSKNEKTRKHLSNTQDLSQQAILRSEQSTQDDNAPGAESLRKASAILQTIRPPPRRLARFKKPRGLLASSSYYLKQAFYLLFMNGPPKADANDPSTSRIRGPLLAAVDLLEDAKREGNKDATFKLAEMSFYGTHTYPRNYTQAFQAYNHLAQSYGNSTAQHMVGFMYATGIGGAVEKDQAKALLYHTYAADAGETRAQMTTAFRHYSGVATPRSCERALYYYKKVARKSIEYMKSGPPGGKFLPKEAISIADVEGGVYGEGASVSSIGEVGRHNAPTDANAAFDDVLEYLDLMSRKGELMATFQLAKFHYEGSRALQRDYGIARENFLDVAGRYWTEGGKVRQSPEKEAEKYAARAAGYLGRMFLRGEGVKQNFANAKYWFELGRSHGDGLSQHSLGLMYLEGYGVEQNPFKAAEHFSAAADHGLAASCVRMGALLLDQGDLQAAMAYFSLATRQGHVEAFYYLAEILERDVGDEARNCNLAASYYKTVAEKAEPLHSAFAEANDAYEDGDLETALQLYMMGAEQGYEAGQSNVAYLLDKQLKSRPKFSQLIRIPITFGRKAKSMLGDAALALIYWTRSAKQDNVDSLVKMGDYYLLGLGTNNDNPDAEKAAACYQAAEQKSVSAQAMWNLGWMHENGIGLDQDFHLAKRFYDLSMDTNKEAYAPVALALLKLRVRSWWNWVTGGSINSIKEDNPPKKPQSFTEWLSNFVMADLKHEYERRKTQENDKDDIMPDGYNADHMPKGTEEDNLYGDYWDEEDDVMIEMLAILALATVLAGLVWYRQMVGLTQRARAENPNNQQQQGSVNGTGGINASDNGAIQNNDGNEEERDRGHFPPPGDPGIPDWGSGVGGIGH